MALINVATSHVLALVLALGVSQLMHGTTATSTGQPPLLPNQVLMTFTADPNRNISLLDKNYLGFKWREAYIESVSQIPDMKHDFLAFGYTPFNDTAVVFHHTNTFDVLSLDLASRSQVSVFLGGYLKGDMITSLTLSVTKVRSNLVLDGFVGLDEFRAGIAGGGGDASDIVGGTNNVLVQLHKPSPPPSRSSPAVICPSDSYHKSSIDACKRCSAAGSPFTKKIDGYTCYSSSANAARSLCGPALLNALPLGWTKSKPRCIVRSPRSFLQVALSTPKGSPIDLNRIVQESVRMDGLKVVKSYTSKASDGTVLNLSFSDKAYGVQRSRTVLLTGVARLGDTSRYLCFEAEVVYC